ncbi:MAG: bifunctional aspartate kinase/homoserine dehydrogenase I [Chitinophagales bacterium]
MRVIKFGGSSVGTPQKIKDVIAITASIAAKEKTAVVVSAFSGVTDNLIAMAQQALQGEEYYKAIYKQLEKRHCEAVKALVPVKQQPQVQGNVIQQLNALYDLCKGISLIKELSPKTLDTVISFGERLSAYIVCEAAKVTLKNCNFLDAREVIKTDSTFGYAKVNFEQTNQLIKNYFKQTTGTIFITGFIGSNAAGETTTLGRSGSDYTASIFGAALKATAIEIWTDVDGIMTTDPRIVKQAFPVPSITYEEAMELSHFGAKVIFPATMRPAMSANIPIWVKNTFNPSFSGTLISNKNLDSTLVVKGISSLNNIALLNVEGSGMLGVAGVSGRLFTALAQGKINIILISQASSEHSICLAVHEGDIANAKQIIEEEFHYEIKSGLIDAVAVKTDLNIVAIVGENMKHLPGTASKMFAALGKNGVNIIAIAQGSSEKNISAVIEAKDRTKALSTLHESFFLSDKKVLNVFVMGVGLVGGKLLDIIEKQRKSLLQKQLIDVRIMGIANSRHMLFQNDEIKNWKNTMLTAQDTSNVQAFLERVKQLNLPNSVIVDATASDVPVAIYENALASNIAIVTPNKRACSGKFNYYQKLKSLSLKHNTHFLYETNVGAGLPVINTLNDLLLSGDEIIKIEAVVSGTLNYLFYHFSEGMSFAELLLKAKELGYTEPDPRDDLSGTDVARKILILARECGSTLELKDIAIENLVPAKSKKATSVEAFFTTLKTEEKLFTEKLLKAKKNGTKLKYIATYENGEAKTALVEVDEKHPFYALAGTENCFSFTTTRYRQYPLVVKGPGAGADVTAAGVFADIIKTINK